MKNYILQSEVNLDGLTNKCIYKLATEVGLSTQVMTQVIADRNVITITMFNHKYKIKHTRLYNIKKKIELLYERLPVPKGFFEIKQTGLYGYFINFNGDVMYKDDRRICKPSLHNDGYKVNTLKYIIDGVNKKGLLNHRLVAQTFLTRPKNCELVVHKDEDKLNNHKDNLKWVNKEEFIRGLSAEGKLNQPKGINRFNSKLDDKKVLNIRKLYKENTMVNIDFLRLMSSKYNVAVSTIKMVVLNRTWKHI